LIPGNYKIKATVRDVIAQREFEKNRMITVINFSSFPFAMSSLMLVSSIEENNGKYLISPHITDNIGNLSEGYFVFFEVYNAGDEKNVTVVAEVNDEDKTIFSEKSNKTIIAGTNQIYIRIPSGVQYGLKNNILKLSIFESQGNSLTVTYADNSYSNETCLAAAQRSIKCISFLSNRITSDLKNAIRQMRYVASSDEIDFINEAPNEAEKVKRLEDFWNKLDPTPNTKKNEAMEEYYFRIDYANKNFKAHSEGWLTDKGQIFIVFGMPMNVERTNRGYSDNRTYEQWIYANNRIFIFLDTSGFGDFRLYNPKIVTDKYQYEY
jgi:GWxTD domain-containing protein